MKFVSATRIVVIVLKCIYVFSWVYFFLCAPTHSSSIHAVAAAAQGMFVAQFCSLSLFLLAAPFLMLSHFLAMLLLYILNQAHTRCASIYCWSTFMWNCEIHFIFCKLLVCGPNTVIFFFFFELKVDNSSNCCEATQINKNSKWNFHNWNYKSKDLPKYKSDCILSESNSNSFMIDVLLNGSHPFTSYHLTFRTSPPLPQWKSYFTTFVKKSCI